MSAHQPEDLRICIDRVVPDEYHPARAATERAAWAGALRAMALPAGAAGAIDVSGNPVLLPAALALISLKMWTPGHSLRCQFLDGSVTQKKKTEAKAHLWEQYANITLQFVRTGKAEIRISFAADPGSWSAIGTDALVERYFPPYQPTMNFGWLKDDTEDAEYERVVVHEFGHALGCIHEHQSPATQLAWNTPEVYRTFGGPPNYWSKEQIDFNILQRYSPTGLRFTRFDPDSIMLYMFPGRLFKDGKPTNLNTQPSTQDKAFISQMYPRHP